MKNISWRMTAECSISVELELIYCSFIYIYSPQRILCLMTVVFSKKSVEFKGICGPRKI